MKTIAWTLPACLTVACCARADETNVLKTDQEKVSYSIGLNIGNSWKRLDFDVDYDWLLRGIKDGKTGGTALLTEQEVRDRLIKFQQDVAARQQEKQRQLAETNAKQAEEFLAKNKAEPGVVAGESGLQYKILTEGAGPTPNSNDTVTVNYRGTLLDGTEFDNSYKRGQPASFPVNGVIKGWTEALQKMKVGSKWQLFIPPNLAYGERGRPGIPPNSLLSFEIELLSNAPPPAVSLAPGAPLTSDIIKVPSLEEMKKGARIETIKAEDVEKLQKQQAQGTNQP